MPIVDTSKPITWAACELAIRRIAERYPFCRTEQFGATAYGRSLRTLVIGSGKRKVLYTAAHHANEWITALVLLKFGEELARKIEEDGVIGGVSARALAETSITNQTRYRVRALPAAGALLRQEDTEEQQLDLLS